MIELNDSSVTVLHGDCLEKLKLLKENSVSSVVCDPPYGLSKEPDIADVLTHWLAGDDYKHRAQGGFMGKAWDSFVPGPAVWKEVLRVIKPGGHALVFAGTRTQDLMAIALRIAGFEIRDCIERYFDPDDDVAAFLESLTPAQRDAFDRLGDMGDARRAWLYGSGMSKAPELGKVVDAKLIQGNSRPEDIRRQSMGDSYRPSGRGRVNYDHGCGSAMNGAKGNYEPQTDNGRKWSGWRGALKPAQEPIIMARKPLDGTVVENLLTHGVGALNIDACRVPSGEDHAAKCRSVVGLDSNRHGHCYGGYDRPREDSYNPAGRFPANVLHDGSDEVLEAFAAFGESKSKAGNRGVQGRHDVASPQTKRLKPGSDYVRGHDDSGTAARFFYSAKAGKSERVVQCTACGERGFGTPPCDCGAGKRSHPTVKPLELMRYLVRLVTPPGGTVLDPFAGSGTTGAAAQEQGFGAVLIELDADHVGDIEFRLGVSSHAPSNEKSPLNDVADNATISSSQMTLF